MAKKQTAQNPDDVLLNINVTGREDLKGAREDAKGLNNELQNGGKTDISAPVKTLKAQIREATLEAQRLYASGKQNTQEYINAAKRVSELKDQQSELNKTFEAFDPDNKFKVFNSIASAGAKAVQGYAGAMAFLGVESEDATRTIAKLQGIMAFTDAISSLADIKDGYNDLLRVLGLTTAKTQELTVATTEQAVVSETATVDQMALEETLAVARERYAAADIATQEAMLAVRAEGIAVSEELNGVEEIYLERAAERQLALTEVTTAENALTASTTGAAVATTEATVATEGLIVAEEGATAASVTLGAALKAIGIGLIIAALAWLVTNFDKVKAAVVKLFPVLGDTGDAMDKLMQTIYGVGNVILQYLIAPINALIALVQGDFKGALQAMQKGFDVVGNYQAGANAELANQRERDRIQRIKDEIELNERLIKERKALGKSTYDLEVANAKRRIEVLDKEKDDYKKLLADAETDLTVIINAERKRRSDEYKALLKADLDNIKANNLEALKVIKTGAANQRKAEIDELDIKYNKEKALLDKRKADVKDYNTQYKNLTEARKKEEEQINKKYDAAYITFQKEVDQAYFSDFEKREAEIRAKQAELLKTATPAQAAKIIAGSEFLSNQNSLEGKASIASVQADTALTNAENANRPLETDTQDEARAKIDALTKARLDADNAAYELKKARLMGQYDELELLEAQHQTAVTDINAEQSNARKEIDRLEAENRLKLFDAIGQGADAVSGILGENTIAGKALAVASASISTYAAIAGQLQAFSKVPIPGYAIAQAIATGVVGLANVKKILQVKVPTKGGNSGSGGGATAPVINSTVLSQDRTGSNDIVDAVNDTNQNQKPLRAYIVNKDLEDQKAKADYFNTQSEY